MLDKQNIPNYLTYGRVLAVPLALGLIVWAPGWHYEALFVLFAAACITDYLDGHLARKWKAESFRGALLDPIADKLLVALMLMFLISHDVSFDRTITMNIYAGSLRVNTPTTIQDSFSGLDLLVPAALIILREIYVSGLREFLSSRDVRLPVSSGGKWKTALQMVSILLLLYAFAWYSAKAWEYGTLALWTAAVLGVYTAYEYTRKSWKHLK